MVKRKTALAIRKVHRYLGLFLGIQFLIWTLSGLYFSWTNLDEIHGDHFRSEALAGEGFDNLIPPALPGGTPVKSSVLRTIGQEPYYFINGEFLVNARTGEALEEISARQARQVAAAHMAAGLKVKQVEKITEAGKHHEYRDNPLPAYVLTYEHPEDLKAYVAARDGQFRMVRHRNWRWFDFLWMTHTMDYEGRDNINTTTLRIFSLMGLVTVLSGFILWFVTSPSLRTLIKRLRPNNTNAL